MGLPSLALAASGSPKLCPRATAVQSNSDPANIGALPRVFAFAYSGITCIVAVPGTVGIITGAGGTYVGDDIAGVCCAIGAAAVFGAGSGTCIGPWDVGTGKALA
jgi:hypothetical protein